LWRAITAIAVAISTGGENGREQQQQEKGGHSSHWFGSLVLVADRNRYSVRLRLGLSHN
jgi:hypothetical protein